MNSLLRTLCTLLLLVLCAGRTPAQDEAKFVRCVRCKNEGALICPQHKRVDCSLEKNVLYCSVVGDCDTCGGTGYIDCDRCENEATEERLATKRAGIPKLVEGHAKIHGDMKRPVRLAESRHFLVVSEVDGMKVGEKRVDAHTLLHLYVDRLERLYQDYVTLLDVQESEFELKSRVMLWGFQDDHRTASAAFCGQEAERGVKLMGATPTYSVPAIKKYFKNDEILHRNVIHMTTHLLFSHQKPSGWVGNIKGGWIDEGLAHWFEDRYFGICDNYCYQEVATSNSFKGGKWRPVIRKLIANDEAPPLAQLIQENTDTLSPEQHAACFSLVDYLMQLDAKKVSWIGRELRRKTPSRDAIQSVLGLNPLKLELRWKDWVLENYPTR